MNIKICGLRRIEDAEYINEFEEIKYAGFVFADTKRYVTPELARDIIKRLRYDIKAVGIFTETTPEAINAIADVAGLDICQLHSDESNEDCAAVRRTVWKAIRVRDESSIRAAESYTNAAGFVLDTYVPGDYGGTGRVFSWDLAKDFGKRHFTVLAGGIGAHNIVNAYSVVKPDVIDLSSSVETDGFKSYEKIYKLIQTVRKEEDNAI